MHTSLIAKNRALFAVSFLAVQYDCNHEIPEPINTPINPKIASAISFILSEI
jgi:hypothetical protein